MNKTSDSFGRRVDYMRVSVTPRCNLRCAYCMPAGRKIYPDGGMLTIADITRLLRIYAPVGIRKVRITGGEPLVRKGISRLIKDLKAIEEIKEVTMSTNGVLLEKMIPELREAGLDRINISLDTLRPERMKEISGHDVFDKVMRVIKRIVDEKIWPLKINVVAIGGVNDDEIDDFARLAHDLPLEVRFIELMPTSHNRLWGGGSFISCGDIESRIKERHALVPVKRGMNSGSPMRTGPASVYSIEGGRGRIGFVSPLSKRFCDDCNRLRLTAEGKLRSCLFSDEEVDVFAGFQNGADDKWFMDRLAESLNCKPRGHELDENSETSGLKPMTDIGG